LLICCGGGGGGVGKLDDPEKIHRGMRATLHGGHMGSEIAHGSAIYIVSGDTQKHEQNGGV